MIHPDATDATVMKTAKKVGGETVPILWWILLDRVAFEGGVEAVRL